ncbi:MAG: shikimate kinase [Thermoplasmata archaeon]
MIAVGIGECFGAGTIVSAVATGKGASFGLDLKVKAKVTLTDEKKFVLKNEDFKEDSLLAELACKKTLDFFGKNYGAIIETESNIPVSKGLKSSSASSIAIIRATANSLGIEMKKEDMLKISCDASLEAGVSITGAFDDASACLFGGVFVTDNIKRKVLVSYEIKPELEVLIYVPPGIVKKESVKKYNFRLGKLKPLVEYAHELALKGDYFTAMNLNGLIYSNAFEQYRSAEVAMIMLNSGALSAGMSGTGPSVVSLVDKKNTESVIEAVNSKIEDDAKIIRTSVRNFERD